MVTKCFIPQCKSVSFPNCKVKFHYFPKELVLKSKWIKALRLHGILKRLGSTSRICSKHFEDNDCGPSKTSGLQLVLKNGAVPNQFSTGFKLNKKPINESRKKRLLNRNYIKELFQENRLAATELESINLPEDNEYTVEIANDIDTSVALYEIPSVDSSVDSYGAKEYSDVGTQTVDDMATSLDHNMLIEFMSDQRLIYFTGFTRERFNLLYGCLKITATLYDNYLSAKNQLVLTLIKYKLAIDYILISELYCGISRNTVSNIFIFWTKQIYKYFKSIDFWRFRYVSDNAYTAIIDCSEIKTQKSSKDPNKNKELFSVYKNTHTFKYLVAIDEKGLVIFCSQAYGGSKSDREIVIDCGFVDNLHEGDIILADRGFDISDILEQKSVTINLPAFKTAQQFEEEQVAETRVIASRRIHVERVIGLSKKQNILCGMIPNHLWPVIDEIIYNANFLCNFKKSVV